MKPANENGLPDLLGQHLLAVFAGLNPGLLAASTGRHFAGKSNRFWKVMHQAGFTKELLGAENDRKILEYGFGLITVVDRPTRSASELRKVDYLAAIEHLKLKIERYRPLYLAFLGKAAYQAIANEQNIQWGPQNTKFGETHVWVLPNPSGLNRGYSLEKLVDSYQSFYTEITNATAGNSAFFH
jgi:TDG/mug DNA glycosylase family protein